jgi:hypothetical protein
VSAAFNAAALLAALVLTPLLSLAACGDDDSGPTRITVHAEVLEPGAPVEVAASEASLRDDSWFEHRVSVTWRGDKPAILDDARFVHRVEGDGGEFITLGRGCGFSVDEQSGELLFPCTADLQIIALDPGETHDYPVSLPPKIESFRMGRGTFVVDEVIQWRQPAFRGEESRSEGRFTVRLTYEVR